MIIALFILAFLLVVFFFVLKDLIKTIFKIHEKYHTLKPRVRAKFYK